MAEPIFVRGGIVIPAALLSWSAARASGPGGQNVNKVASKVELFFDFERMTALSDEAKAELRTMSAYLEAADESGRRRMRIASQRTRDQGRNLDDARAKLASIVAAVLAKPKPRKATRPSRGARERRLDSKHKLTERKASRRIKGDD